MTFPTATARKTAYGFKAVIKRADGSTHVTHHRNFKSRDAALAHAERYIVANYSQDAHIRKWRAEQRFDAQFRAFQARNKEVVA